MVEGSLEGSKEGGKDCEYSPDSLARLTGAERLIVRHSRRRRIAFLSTLSLESKKW